MCFQSKIVVIFLHLIEISTRSRKSSDLFKNLIKQITYNLKLIFIFYILSNDSSNPQLRFLPLYLLSLSFIYFLLAIRCSKVEDFHYESNQNPIQLFDVEQNFPLETEEGRSSCPITSRTNLQRDELAYGEGDHTADNTPKNNLTRLQRLSIFKMNHNVRFF